MSTCGSFSELDNDLHNNYDMQSKSFIWPTTARIIQAFHEEGNDGINISVCSGTSAQAIEGGELPMPAKNLLAMARWSLFAIQIDLFLLMLIIQN